MSTPAVERAERALEAWCATTTRTKAASDLAEATRDLLALFDGEVVTMWRYTRGHALADADPHWHPIKDDDHEQRMRTYPEIEVRTALLLPDDPAPEQGKADDGE